MSETIVSELYEGKVRITFSPGNHRYSVTHNGEKVWWPSVTAVTGVVDKSQVLIPWAVRLAETSMRQYFEKVDGPYTVEQLLPIVEEACQQHKQFKKRAADLGDIVHDYAEAYAKAQLATTELPAIPDPKDIPEGAVLGIRAFIDWVTKHDVKFIVAERMVASSKNGFVGTLDAIALVDGKHYLIDYKTAKAVYAEAWLQTAGYLLAFNEETGQGIKNRMVLHFSKETGEFAAHISDKHKQDTKAFVAALKLKKWVYAMDKAARV